MGINNQGREDGLAGRQQSKVSKRQASNKAQRDQQQENERLDPATARMEAQSMRWVDGEKMLKKKLQVLYDRQQEGKDLGVPVLARYLGEDIPVWVTPDKEAEWQKKVDLRYEEMRQEEEEWKKKMANIIASRERNIGVTTA